MIANKASDIENQLTRKKRKASSGKLGRFIEFEWPNFERRGWHIEYGRRPTDCYFFPPGVTRGRGKKCRVHFFDSVAQLKIYLQKSDGNAELMESLIRAERAERTVSKVPARKSLKKISSGRSSRVGEEFDAVVEDWNPKQKKYDEISCAKQIFTPENADTMAKLDEAIQTIVKSRGHKIGSVIDKIHDILAEHNYNVDEAVKYVERSMDTLILQFLPRWCSWSENEKTNFAQLFSMHGRNFEKFRCTLRSRSMREIIEFYYGCWKHTEPYRERKNAAKNHDDICYACDATGELLMCDTCPNAFHLKCAIPRLTKIPKDDWHCHFCRQNRSEKR